LHGDHLGSASLMTDGGGSIVGQARYKPFGEKRSEWNIYFTNRKSPVCQKNSTRAAWC